jgi:hypothetical protein
MSLTKNVGRSSAHAGVHPSEIVIAIIKLVGNLRSALAYFVLPEAYQVHAVRG